jgi:hypothetical protein
VRHTGSAAIECAFVAAGLLRVARFARPHVWKVAGGVALVRASGGEVRTRSEAGWIPSNGSICEAPIGAGASRWSWARRRRSRSSASDTAEPAGNAVMLMIRPSPFYRRDRMKLLAAVERPVDVAVNLFAPILERPDGDLA